MSRYTRHASYVQRGFKATDTGWKTERRLHSRQHPRTPHPTHTLPDPPRPGPHPSLVTHD
ncbi:hypothetical protein E2C01_038878 [Portunus trituberculatus]|uniref:Uncharacterized protein n=1 Tax=Portunus trituberculatus TaxID=210409 RepID=A0A5B7FJP9_PORTR|nr:hypothetical protein [Portunus trituberculatus]